MPAPTSKSAVAMNPPPAPRVLGHRAFTAQDQRFFAAASRDHNPMHVDPVAARRLLSGRQVVHGIHTLLCLLDLHAARDGALPAAIDCSFANPVSGGDEVLFTETEAADGRRALLATVDGVTCTEVRFDVAVAAPAPPAATTVPRRIDPTQPLDEAPEAQAGQSFAFDDWPVPLADAFPHATRLLGEARVAAIARLSTFVGMVCPGLHSVFSTVQIRLDAEAPVAGSLRFQVQRYDPRFRLFVVAFDGCIAGELRAFRRPPPQPQASSRELAGVVAADEFAGTHSLVVGGSRGLGELTAKLLAAGGGAVSVSYAVGADDAARLCEEINAAGRGRSQALRLDLQAEPFEPPAAAPGQLDAVFYFATPRIFKKKAEVFDRAAFDSFTAFYLQRFHDLCRWLDAGASGRRITVYLPSTVFITERPKGMTEYAMAKAAAEVLADDLNRTLRSVRIVHTRLPRLATDQTASIQGLGTASNVETLLGAVRAVMAAG